MRRARLPSSFISEASSETDEHADVLKVVLARAARSARLTTHFDLEFPRSPQHGPYWCYKHSRTCRPVTEADKFLRRYLLDTLVRLQAFQRISGTERAAEILHADARNVVLERRSTRSSPRPRTPV